MNKATIREVGETLRHMPFGAGITPSFPEVVDAGSEAEVIELLSTYLAELQRRLATHAANHDRLVREHDALKRDREATRRYLGIED